MKDLKDKTTGTNFIDAHCHYFNGAYALRELVAIGWNLIWGNYPHRKPGLLKAEVRGLRGRPVVEGWGSLVKYVARLVATIARTCRGNYDYEQEKFSDSGIGGGASLITAPLMMDIYYIFDNGEEDVTQLDSLSKTALLPTQFTEDFVASRHRQQFREYLQRIKMEVKKQLPAEARALDYGVGKGRQAGPDLDRLLKDIEDEFMGKGSVRMTLAARVLDNVEMSKGYAGEITDLQDLHKGRKDRIFPFLAVDPRRIGIMNLVRNVGKGKEFAGVKLYPPLGYLPTHPNLYPVYDYCIKNDVPITVHCSDGGFPTPLRNIYVRSTENRKEDKWVKLNKENTASQFFADPEKWRPILEDSRYKKLRLNFAHFGGMNQVLDYSCNPEKNTWPKKIVKFMTDHPNVYADLAYCPDKTIVEAVEKITDKEQIVNKRLMFGTDFIMIMFERELGGLENYFSRFAQLASPMFTDNPRRFFGI